jgi:outer membrane protein
MGFVLGCLMNLGAGEPIVQAATLREVFQSALSRTEALPLQESQARQADERVSQARGGLLPTVGFNGVFTRQHKPSTGSANAFTLADQRNLRLNLTQPVFRGLREFAGLRAAQAQSRAQEDQTRQVRVSVYSTVGQSFFNVAAAEQDVRDLEELLDLSQKRLVEIRDRVRIGRSRPGDLLSAQSQVATVQAQIQAAQVVLEQARDSFAFVTGLDRKTPVDLGAGSGLPEKIAPLADYLKRIDSRPDLSVQREQLASAEESVSVARGAHLPSVDLSGNYYLDRTGILADTKWDFSVTATLPIFQGGVLQSQVREAAERRTSQELLVAQARRTAEREIQAAWQAADGALAQIRFLSEARDAADRNYREQQKDYRLGLITNLDVLQALNSYQDIRRSYDRTRFQARSALVALEASVGEAP